MMTRCRRPQRRQSREASESARPKGGSQAVKVHSTLLGDGDDDHELVPGSRQPGCFLRSDGC